MSGNGRGQSNTEAVHRAELHAARADVPDALAPQYRGPAMRWKRTARKAPKTRA